MPLRLLSTSFHRIDLRTRIPFKFGITTMTAAPHLFVRVEMEMGGKRSHGISADLLPPKWFTKNPATTLEDDRRDMMIVIRAAADHARELPVSSTLFEFWQSLYRRQKQWAADTDYPPLLWNFGVSLIERAAIDATCRAMDIPFAAALRSGQLGFDPVQIHPEITADFRNLLPREPLKRIIARHTVGLSDPLTDDEILVAERVNDGFPQSLRAAIAAYGLTHFKIKLSGDIAKDLARLKQLAELLADASPNYAYTLDGNENFRSLAPFRELWDSLVADPSLRLFLSRLIFVEQPIHRDVALSIDLHGSADLPPIVIDESDAELASLPAALDAGYVGTSHKNCKGIFKGLANACLLAHRRRQDPSSRFILSGEDLTNIGPVALMEDLAVMATLGIEHVERNGHHYFAGLSAFPQSIQQGMLAAHPDVFERRAGTTAVRISGGVINVESVNRAPFGYNVDPDLREFQQLESV